MRPIAFMRLRSLEEPKKLLQKYKPSELVVEQKFDGFKVMATRDREVRLYSRRGQDLTKKVPAVVNHLKAMLKPGDTVLGELIYIKDGKQSIECVQSILNSKSPARAVAQTKKFKGKLEFIVYDILKWRGASINEEPFTRRHKALVKTVRSQGPIRTSRLYTWGKRNLAMKKAIDTGGEGIVIKLKSSPYVYRKSGETEPFGHWWKYKAPDRKSYTDDVILYGYVKRAKRLAFKMYQISGGKEIYVGNISNLPRATEAQVKKETDRGKRVVAEISYQERFPSGKFRHPGWVRLRPDKPIKSATMGKAFKMKKNPCKSYEAYVLVEDGDVVILEEFSSADMLMPTMAAKEAQLSVDKAQIARGDKELKKALRKQPGKIRKKKKSKGRKKNPRNSMVKDALATEATSYDSFEQFSKAYWNECARGIYWHPTNEKRFFIGDAEIRQAKAGKFVVACNPEIALAGKKNKYVAELDVSRLKSGDISVKRGTAGSEIKLLSGLERVKVMRVLEADRALKAFKWQLSILPSSKDELHKFWEKAHEKKRAMLARAKMRRRKEAEREEKREERRKAKRKKAALAEIKKKKAERKKEEQQRKAAEKAKAKEKREAAARKKKAAKKTAKKASKKKGKWKRVPTSNPSKSTRRISSRVNNPGC